MASCFFDKRSWTAKFKGLDGGDRRIRIPVQQVAPEKTAVAKKRAKAYAEECERYCEMLAAAPRKQDADHALDLGAITEAQHAALLNSQPIPAAVAPDPDSPGEVTIEAAALRHPSSIRETGTIQAYHLTLVRNFVVWTGKPKLCQLDVGDVSRWVQHLREKSWKWDSRRHALLWIRRASAIAPSLGLRDVLGGRMRIDRREIDEHPVVEAWTLTELGMALRRFAPELWIREAVPFEGDRERDDRRDHRMRAAVVLGGFLGFRPSECIDLDCRDINLVALQIDTGRKTLASIRTIPITRLMAEWLRPLVENRPPGDPVFRGWSGRSRGRAFSATTWSQWLAPLLAEATGRALQAKCLRKSFDNWAKDVLPGHITEAYLGHDDPRVTKVTNSHYRIRASPEALRPAARRIERHLLRAMHLGWAKKRGHTEKATHSIRRCAITF